MSLRHYIWSGILVLGAAALAAASPASAQGFMVKPMRMEATPRAGQTIELPLQIRNTAGEDARPIELSLVELSQSPTGSWKIADASEVSRSRLEHGLDFSERERGRNRAAGASRNHGAVQSSNKRQGRLCGRCYRRDAGARAGHRVWSSACDFSSRSSSRSKAARPSRRSCLDDVVMSYSDGSDGKPATTSAHLRIVNQWPNLFAGQRTAHCRTEEQRSLEACYAL